jgi:hypothetical protein
VRALLGDWVGRGLHTKVWLESRGVRHHVPRINSNGKMIMRMPYLFLGAALIGAAMPAIAAQRDNKAGEAALAKAIAGRVAGKPVSCINQPRVRSSQVIDGTAIVYDVGGTLYVNRPRIGAESLDDDDILVSRTVSTQLCSLDTIRLVDNASRIDRGFVTLDEFVPYTKPKS